MLIPPRLGGVQQFAQLLADVPRQYRLQILGVSDRTLRRWLAGSIEIPPMALQALYWFTRWGDAEIQSRYGFEVQQLRGLARCDGERLARFAVLPAANSPSAAPALRLVV